MKQLIMILAAAVVSAAGALWAAPKAPLTIAPTTAPTTVKHAEWTRNAVIYEVNLRQYTPERSIKAFAKQLPQLKELGVDILWFMPIFPISELNRKGELGSYYAVQDYKDVNPEFGSLYDFKKMVRQAHALGLKVILDWVPNHSGCDNLWVTEHPDWYAHNDKGEMFGPYDWTDVYKFDYSRQGLRDAMRDAFLFWIKEADVDGFRCDVAFEVPTDFWEWLRPQLNAQKEVFMLAEADTPDLVANAFDALYNWPMRNVQDGIGATMGQNNRATDKTPRLHAAAIDDLLIEQAGKYAADSYMMNMITNHDLNSWEGTEFDRYGEGVRTFAVLEYTLPGMPLIYTGQEVGWNHAFEFFVNDVTPNWTKNDTFEFYRCLNSIKHSESALQAGTKGAPMVRYLTKSADAYIFSRGDLLIMLNLSDRPVDVKYTGAKPAKTQATDLLTGKAQKIPTRLNPWEYHIFK